MINQKTVVLDPADQAVQILPSPEQVHQVRCPDRRRGIQRRQRGCRISAKGIQDSADRQEYGRWQFLRSQRRIFDSQIRTGRRPGNLGDALPGHRPRRPVHQEEQHRLFLLGKGGKEAVDSEPE
jgi:hypothetical protein